MEAKEQAEGAMSTELALSGTIGEASAFPTFASTGSATIDTRNGRDVASQTGRDARLRCFHKVVKNS